MSGPVHFIHLYNSSRLVAPKHVNCELCGEVYTTSTRSRWVDTLLAAREGYAGVYIWCTPDHPRVVLAEVHSS